MRIRIGELLAECMATFIILGLGDSAAAMYTLYDPSPYQQAYWGVCIAWGLAVTLAIYVTGPVSGTHANPAVTLALTLFRGFPRPKVLPYVAAQVLGAVPDRRPHRGAFRVHSGRLHGEILRDRVRADMRRGGR